MERSVFRNCLLYLVITALMAWCAACAVKKPDQQDRVEAMNSRCKEHASFAGNLVVGNPVPEPTAPLTRTVEPGDTESAPPPAALPVLEVVDISYQLEGTEKVAYHFDGNGSIGWSARFVEVATVRGTGAQVPVAGACILQVDFTGVDAAASATGSDRPIRLPEGKPSKVVEVFVYPNTDGIAQSYVGIRNDKPLTKVDSGSGLVVVTFG